jgi:type II secretory pathway component PulC
MFPEDQGDTKGKSADDAAPPEEAEKLPPGTVARKSVDDVLVRGPATLLRRIETEEVLRQNKFVGWRLIAFPAEWDRTGLQPGDVITDLNGIVLEKPDDLWTAWVGMADASELRIGLERDGKPGATVVKIQGAPSQATKEALSDGNGPKQTAATKKKGGRRDTVVITNGSDDDPSQFPEY